MLDSIIQKYQVRIKEKYIQRDSIGTFGEVYIIENKITDDLSPTKISIFLFKHIIIFFFFLLLSFVDYFYDFMK